MTVDLFLKLDQIPGESIDKTYANSIDLLAFSWGLTNSSPIGAPPSSGKPNLQDISVTKYVDLASVPLFRACLLNTVIRTGTLIVRKPGNGTVAPLVDEQLALQNVRIGSISGGGSGGEDRLTETVTMSFEVIKFTYVKPNATGGPGATNNYAWNVLQQMPG